MNLEMNMKLRTLLVVKNNLVKSFLCSKKEVQETLNNNKPFKGAREAI